MAYSENCCGGNRSDDQEDSEVASAFINDQLFFFRIIWGEGGMEEKMGLCSKYYFSSTCNYTMLSIISLKLEGPCMDSALYAIL